MQASSAQSLISYSICNTSVIFLVARLPQINEWPKLNFEAVGA